MLTHIHIRHFTIIKSLSMDFQSGLQVLTGETGAGKSIWVDALQIAFGERADASIICTSADFCEINLCFDLSQLPHALKLLAEQNIDAKNECVIRRVIYRDKPSRTTINGIPIPQHMMRELSPYLLCIHSQHQHQRLLKSFHQQQLLDQFARHSELLASIQHYYTQWKMLQEELQLLQHQAKISDAESALWQYQLDEIQSLQLKENEFDELFQHYQLLQKSSQFIATVNEASAWISENEQHPDVLFLLHRAIQCLQAIKTSDKKLLNIQSLLETAEIHLQEAKDALHHFANDIDFQCSKLTIIEERLTTLQDIARKHHIKPEKLIVIEKELQEKIQAISNRENKINELIQQQKKLETKYQNTAQILTNRREQAAVTMANEITLHMQSLGMNGGKCEIILDPHTQGIYSNGNESVIFLVSTNPGQIPKPLTDTLSGGELSRLSLIIHILTAQTHHTPTLIFDEVDTGIGGKTANIVGQLLRQLGNETQVLCITHLPQVAACGHHHFKAEKIIIDNETVADIRPLNHQERINEIARMISGTCVTEKSTLHAQELLAMQES